MDFNIFNVLSDPLDSDSIDIPITDGTYETGMIAERFRNGVFVIVFFDSAGNIVTPTGGYIEPRMATFIIPGTNQAQWLEPSGGDIKILAMNVKAGDATYTPSLFHGPTVKGKIKLVGIEGADHCKAFFWRTA